MTIHILSFNIHKGVGWRIRKSTLNLIHEQICELQPDIVFLQEIRGSQFEILTSNVWPHSCYGKNAIYHKGHHGNAILSKFPITFVENIDLSMHRFENRGLLYSTIQYPEQDCAVHLLCVHLGLFVNDRRKQLDKIVSFINSTIPDHEPLILSGDFNDWNNYAVKPLVKSLGLHEAFMDSHGSYARTYPAWSPFFKLDRVYFRGFHAKEANRLAQKTWKNLSDHIAIEVRLDFK